MAQTQQQSLITATVDGRPIPEPFDTLSGGETTADPTKRRPGGMKRAKSYAALSEDGDLTISRDYERARDHALMKTLRRRVGKAFGTVTERLLDDDGVPTSDEPTTYTGRLTGVNPGELDSDSSDPRMLELTFQIVDVQ